MSSLRPDAVGTVHDPAGGTPGGEPLREDLRVVELCRVLWNGGVQRAAIAQTEGLRARGRHCDLIFLRAVPGTAYALPSGTTVLSDGDLGRSSTAAELSRAITARFAGHRGRDASVDLDLLWQVRTRVREYDVAVYNDQYGALLGGWLRILHRQPYVVMFHEFYPKVPRGVVARVLGVAADMLDLLSILVAPAIITTSARVRQRIDRIAPGRTFLARLGAPDRDRTVTFDGRDRRSVFSITVWDRGRQPELFLLLARALPEFRFVVAGIWTDPAYLAQFRDQARPLANLSVVGPVSEAERDRLQSESLLYLRLGYDESGPGMGGLEALAAGSIVLANRGLGLSECLEDGRNGFVVDQPDPRAVIALLRRIDGLELDRLREISRAARDLALANSWTAHVRELERALAYAVARRPPVRPHDRPLPQPERAVSAREDPSR